VVLRKLFVRGSLPPPGVAIVGSREPPVEAAAFAYRLAFALGEPIVAGLAPGIDASAHRGAIAAGVPTVAFVGYGFGRTDPPEHVELEEAIVRAGGAIATLLPPGTPGSPEARIERDRLQAEHALAVVLVSTEIDGGAMHTMQFARELGRLHLAVRPPLAMQNSTAWAGNLRCIEEGATPLPLEVEPALRIIARRLGRQDGGAARGLPKDP
jgi:DNA processing protein